ncbi:hypothetical protein M8J76_001456 [Diaphorina citri]|nr:hypothetical protein M8J76_001456 [Diaphorina citri]
MSYIRLSILILFLIFSPVRSHQPGSSTETGPGTLYNRQPMRLPPGAQYGAQGAPQMYGAVQGGPQMYGAVQGGPQMYGAIQGPQMYGAVQGGPQMYGAIQGAPTQYGFAHGHSHAHHHRY